MKKIKSVFQQNLEKVRLLYGSHKKIFWIGGGVLSVLVFFLVFNSSPNQDETAAQVQYAKVTRGDLTESIDVVGTLEAQPMVELSWESSGIVSSFDINTGDKVVEGQVLMALEESSLSSSILQAQTDLLEAKAALDNLQSANSNLFTAAQTLSEAEYNLRQYESNRKYWNIKGSSWDQIEEARDAYYAAQQVVWEKDDAYKALLTLDGDDPKRTAAYEDYQDAAAASEKALRVLNNLLGTYYSHAADIDFITYDQGKAAVAAARVDYLRYLNQDDEIAAAEANVQALQNTIDQATIIAPFDGTITNITAVSGEKVTSGDIALRMDNLDNLIVKVSISEVDINKISLGQRVEVTFDAITGKEYKGEVSAISAAGSDESGVVEFNVNVKVLDADESVKPGFTAVVSIITSEVTDALLVPNGAVVSRDGKSIVVLVNTDGSTTNVPVETGATSDVYTEITSGDITEGSQVAVYSSQNDAFGGFMMGPMMGGGEPPQGDRQRQNQTPQN